MSLPVSDKTLEKNISITIGDIVRLFIDADKVKGRAKTVYYKCILLLAASVLEALVYHYIDCSCQKDPSLMAKANKKKLKQLTPLNSETLGTSKQLVIAEEVTDEITLEKIAISSNTMNKFCLDNGLINKDLFAELDYARTKRNQIHLQTLDTTSRNYTVKMIDRIVGSIDQVLIKLDILNPPV